MECERCRANRSRSFACIPVAEMSATKIPAGPERPSNLGASGKAGYVEALRATLQAAAAAIPVRDGNEPFDFLRCRAEDPDWLLGAAWFRGLLGLPAETPVEMVELGKFFEDHPAAGWRETKHDDGYEPLQRVLRGELRNVRVYRVGSGRVHCYIVGRDRFGALAGLRTVVFGLHRTG